MGRTPAGQTRARILDYMTRRLLAGEPPTVREVRDAFGFRAVQTARAHLEALVGEGRLAKVAGRARGYRLPGRDASRSVPVLVPVLGRVEAGRPALAVENAGIEAGNEDYVAVRHAERGSLFALRVRGESMRDAAILPDDIVIVRRQTTASNGDVVVALVSGPGDAEPEATVKRLRRVGRRVELHAANPAFAPIVANRDRRVTVLGKVIEVRRPIG